MKDRETLITAVDRVVSTAVPASKRSAVTNVSPWRKIHRSLRGRYPVAILVALVGIAVGGFLGWRVERPLYRGTGTIYFNPVAAGPQGTATQSLRPLFESFLASQVQMIRTGKVTRRAMETEVWQATGGSNDPEATRAFQERRAIVRVPGTHVVRVEFVDPDPDVAVAGVRAVIEAYQDLYAELHDEDEVGRGTGEEEKLLVRRLRNGMARLVTLTSEFGGVGGLEIRHRAAARLMMSTEDALRSLRSAIEGDVRSPARVGAPGSLSPSEIAVESKQMRAYLAHLALQEAEEKVLAGRPEDTALRVIELRSEIAVLKEGIDDLARDWNRERAARNAGAPTQQELETREKGLVSWLEDLQERTRELGRIQEDARKLQTENDELNGQLLRMEALDEELAPGPAEGGRLQIADPGMRPTAPFRDTRKLYAAIAAAIGGLLGFLIVLLPGLVDRRLKSAVGADDVLSRVRSLGLLPALPTDPDDAEGGRIATHFTHQIRTLLEIAHARQQGACICVSGPATGSGKTTLTAALGLSFGSTGSRTLLVDADPAGRGLTRMVMQMLVSRVRHAGSTNGSSAHGATGRGVAGEADHPLLEPLVPRQGSAPYPAPEELESLLTGAIRRLGLRGATEMGLVDDLFSLADLLATAEARDRLALTLMDALASDGELASGSPAEWIPARTRELRFPGAELDAVPLEPHLYRTGVDTLRFLPLPGKTCEGGASVAVIAALLARLRDRFDVVLVDVGPVPGADESSLVAVYADSVVLVVSPEDHGPETERTLAHLEEIGACVVGAVFNRADQRDIAKTGRTLYVSHDQRPVG